MWEMFTVSRELVIRDAQKEMRRTRIWQQHKCAINYEVADNNGTIVSHSDPASKSFLNDRRMVKCTLHTMPRNY